MPASPIRRLTNWSKQIAFAKDRDTLIDTSCAHSTGCCSPTHFVIPTYTLRNSRMAYWNRLARPDELPLLFNSDFPDIWWFKGDQ
jgi:microcin C transport system substrate-binding protein